MKTISIILMILLGLPIAMILFNAYHIYSIQDTLMPGSNNKFVFLEMLSPILLYVMFIFISLFLNIKSKYLENSVMCGTLIVAFILSEILSFSMSIAFQWLK